MTDPALPQLGVMYISEDTGSTARWLVIYPDYTPLFYGDNDTMRITTEQSLPISVNPLTPHGRAAVVDGAVLFWEEMGGLASYAGGAVPRAPPVAGPRDESGGIQRSPLALRRPLSPRGGGRGS